LLFYLAAAAVRETSGMKQPVAARLPRTDQLREDLLTDTLRNIQKFYKKLTTGSDSDSVARGPLLLKKLNSQWDRKKANAKKTRGGK
jgi:hypothetical protein